MSVDITLYSSWNRSSLLDSIEEFYANIELKWYSVIRWDSWSKQPYWTWSWVWKWDSQNASWIHISTVGEWLSLFRYALFLDYNIFFKPRSRISFQKFWPDCITSNKLIEELIKNVKWVDKAVIWNGDGQYDIKRWWLKQDNPRVISNYKYIAEDKIDYIESLILWNHNHPYVALYYFTEIEFNAIIQQKFIWEAFYDKEEFVILREIYINMKLFFEIHPKPWSKDRFIHEREKQDIELLIRLDILIYKLFSLPSNEQIFSLLNERHWCSWFATYDQKNYGDKIFKNWNNPKKRDKIFYSYIKFLKKLL